MTSKSLSDGCAWVDGEFVAIADARIPLLDTGFTRSDLTYDVVGVWGGKFFRLEDHLDRVVQGCRLLRLKMPFPREEIRRILLEMIGLSGLRESYVSLIVTRGLPTPGERDPRKIVPRLYAYAVPYVWILRQEDPDAAVSLILARDVNRIPPKSIDPRIKNFQWGDFIRGQFEAFDRGGDLGLLTDGSGNVTEGGGFNFFYLCDQHILRTPSEGVLPGITKRTVLEIASELGLETQVGSVPADLVHEADEMFLTSTAGGVIPVSALDGVPVGDGRPGPFTRKIRARYWQLHEDSRFTTDVPYPDW